MRAFQEASKGGEVESRFDWTAASFVLAMAQYRCGRREEAMQVFNEQLGLLMTLKGVISATAQCMRNRRRPGNSGHRHLRPKKQA